MLWFDFKSHHRDSYFYFKWHAANHFICALYRSSSSKQFVKFANIEEDTPSYHRSYDDFVSHFSEMCHSTYEDPDIRTKWVE